MGWLHFGVLGFIKSLVTPTRAQKRQRTGYHRPSIQILVTPVMCLNCALKVPVTVPGSVVKGVVIVLTNTPASDVHCSYR